MEEMTDWDLEIDDAEVKESSGGNTDFVVLPKGNYKFSITKVEHATFQPKAGKQGGIDKPCKQIKLGIIVDGGALGKSWVDDNLFAWPSCLPRILSVLKSIGEIQDGFKGKIGDHLDALKGAEGVCKVDVEKYHSNKYNQDMEKNVIKVYFKPSEKVELSVGDAGEAF